MATKRSLRRVIQERLEPRALLSDGPPAGLRGIVFRDANSNGIFETTEHGQANAKVYLDYNNNGARDGDAEPLAVTSSTGQYAFNNVRTGSPVAVRLSLTGTNLQQTFPTNNAGRTVTPVAGQVVEVERFGVNEPAVPPTPAPASVSGIVFRDVNGDGVRQSAEPGQPNVTVYADYNNDGARASTEPAIVTSASGEYRFTGVTAGGPVALRLLLAGTNFTQTLPVANGARIVTPVAGQGVAAEAFGVKEREVTPPTPTTGTVEGLVFRDRNEDGVRQPTEAGQRNVRVYLDLNGDGQRQDGEAIALTSESGSYRFANVVPRSTLQVKLLLTGTRLKQTLPVNDGGRSINVVAGQTSRVEPFGVNEILPAAISGTIYNDQDDDGARDASETGLAHVLVYLDANGNGTRDADEQTALTRASGQYVFADVPVDQMVAVRLDLEGTRYRQRGAASRSTRFVTATSGVAYEHKNLGVRVVRKTSIDESNVGG